MQLNKKQLYQHDYLSFYYIYSMLNFYILKIKSMVMIKSQKKEMLEINSLNNFSLLMLNFLHHYFHFFNRHKILIIQNFQKLISCKLNKNENERSTKSSDELKKIFLSTNVSCQFPNVELEVILSNDSAVGSSSPTEKKKTKTFRNIWLNDKTDLKKFKEENSSRRISEGSEATSSEQKKEHWQGKI
jgi:hypothetical protein